MKNVKITSIFIVASLSVLVFAGCGSSSSMKNPTIPKAPISSNTGNNTENTQIHKTESTVAMKKLYSKTLKDLVMAKKITQAQANKVLEVVTSTKLNGTVTTPSSGTGTGTGTTPGKGANTGISTSKATNDTTPSNNGLLGLVNSKVINQAQANMINQKIQEALKNK